MSELAKMIIIPYEDAEYTVQAGDPYEVLINPEELSVSNKIHYSQEQAPGSSEPTLKFDKITSSDFKIKFLFDGTGILQANTSVLSAILPADDPPTVADQIALFEQVVGTYSGVTHEPFYVSLIWGDFIFDGRLSNISISYTLFKQDGTALRAVADCTFMSSVDPEYRAKKENNQSPDLTHVRTVKAGDNLLLMCDEIYGDQTLYPQVAKVNKLANFRNLKEGQELIFPPIV